MESLGRLSISLHSHVVDHRSKGRGGGTQGQKHLDPSSLQNCMGKKVSIRSDTPTVFDTSDFPQLSKGQKKVPSSPHLLSLNGGGLVDALIEIACSGAFSTCWKNEHKHTI